jgi:phosphatidylserine/phosphatidylglycerophosphate/cardiolipin synthase-like enzyme
MPTPGDDHTITDASSITFIPDNQYLFHLLDIIKEARQNIAISTFMGNLLEYKKSRQSRALLAELQSASNRRVGIRLLCSKTMHTDLFAGANVDVRTYTGDGIYHAKFVVVDSRSVLLGSHNITYNAAMRNKETSLRIESRQLAQRLERYFNAQFAVAKSASRPRR